MQSGVILHWSDNLWPTFWQHLCLEGKTISGKHVKCFPFPNPLQKMQCYIRAKRTMKEIAQDNFHWIEVEETRCHEVGQVVVTSVLDTRLRLPMILDTSGLWNHSAKPGYLCSCVKAVALVLRKFPQNDLQTCVWNIFFSNWSAREWLFESAKLSKSTFIWLAQVEHQQGPLEALSWLRLKKTVSQNGSNCAQPKQEQERLVTRNIISEVKVQRLSKIGSRDENSKSAL